MRNSSTSPSFGSSSASANPAVASGVPNTAPPYATASSAAVHPPCIRNSGKCPLGGAPPSHRPLHSSATLRSNASNVFYYSGGQRRRSRPFTYGFGVRGGRKNKELQTWIRCLTVIAYFCVVSLPGLLFSYFYTRVWDPFYLNSLVGHPFNSSELATLSADGPTTTIKRMPKLLEEIAHNQQ
ncbi:hypothetical protein niasHT_034495 [Heterodera trifolii]|uniref:Transmembrane protein n=1 Tax=Heterodera trifolii TaxID=157864 RepID=A0ABD2HWM8_9BILA